VADISIGVNIAWQAAAAEMAQSRHAYIEPAHLFIGLCSLDKVLYFQGLDVPMQAYQALGSEWGLLAGLLAGWHLDAAGLRRALRAQLGDGGVEPAKDGVAHRATSSREAFDRASEYARDAGATTLGVHHLFAALLEGDALIANVLRDKGADMGAMKREALDSAKEPPKPERIGEETIRGRSNAEGYLARFSRDLTSLAAEDKLQPPIGRRAEMLRVARTLARDTKNNPVLIGDAGVGKTAVVEGLAWRIAKGRAPLAVRDSRILQLDVSALVAGAKYRGDFEARLQGVLEEVSADPSIVLFIDEIHTLVGAGSAEGVAMDAANIMKPALSRGEARVIGATTRDEYRRYIERDPALERRFQPIAVEEPSVEEALEILQGLKQRLETHHGVTIDDAALQAAVTLSARHLPDRRLPDKAIDLLDEACASMAVQWTSRIPGLEPIQDESGAVSADIVAQALAEWTGIPVARLRDDERERLRSMAEVLRQRVIGQDEACETVAEAVQRARLGLKDAHRPVAVLFFVGPTGVGKTELAKAVAEFLFGSERAMLRFDMSEYQERHTVSRLIGAPPGYVGHEEAGQLTEALRRTPHSLVLLDEFEKAHADMHNLFLQVFDDGRLSDAKGRLVNASNALFILTSNAPVESKRPMGFHVRGGDETRRALVEWGLRPELVNRFDEVVVFRPLNAEALARIAGLLLEGFRARLALQEVRLDWDNAVLAHLAKEGSSEQFGARPLRRAVEQQVENVIAGMLLRYELDGGEGVSLQVRDDDLVAVVERDPDKTW